MLRRYFLPVLLPTLIISKLATACPAPGDPEIDVHFSANKPIRDTSLTISGLSQLSKAGSREGMEKYNAALGLTEAAIAAQAQYRIEAAPDGAGGFCGKLEAAQIAIGWATRVRIAGELVPGSCVYDEVVKHEGKHVAIDQDLMATAQDMIVGAVRHVGEMPVTGATAAEVQKIIQAAASQAIKAAIDSFRKLRDEHQLALDTPEEYDHLNGACGRSEVQRILNGE